MHSLRRLALSASVLLTVGGAVVLGVNSAPVSVPDVDSMATAAPATPTAGVSAPAGPAPATTVPTGRLVIGSADLDAPLLLTAVIPGQALNPPTTTDAFLVEGYGKPADEKSGTSFVLMHSGRGTSHGLGDALVDRQSGEASLEVGAEIILNGVQFTVTGTRVVEKGRLSGETDLWSGEHDLVLITCQQFADSSPSKNALIFARRS